MEKKKTFFFPLVPIIYGCTSFQHRRTTKKGSIRFGCIYLRCILWSPVISRKKSRNKNVRFAIFFRIACTTIAFAIFLVCTNSSIVPFGNISVNICLKFFTSCKIHFYRKKKCTYFKGFRIWKPILLRNNRSIQSHQLLMAFHFTKNSMEILFLNIRSLDKDAIKVTVIIVKPSSQLNKAKERQVSCYAHFLIWERIVQNACFTTFYSWNYRAPQNTSLICTAKANSSLTFVLLLWKDMHADLSKVLAQMRICSLDISFSLKTAITLKPSFITLTTYVVCSHYYNPRIFPHQPWKAAKTAFEMAHLCKLSVFVYILQGPLKRSYYSIQYALLTFLM